MIEPVRSFDFKQRLRFSSARWGRFKNSARREVRARGAGASSPDAGSAGTFSVCVNLVCSVARVA